ncbi:esterase [Sansalvadorimonas sp. 2012CJ34-2]|uniref:Esterase n=1 Tax=Parendozoicomonas callyspongiae TaxID=2942213 RepID=A0ABT0PEJ2_9GAMM|nr:esterase [Sansalvadorimonas sp. 2012CJ34-2]
MVDKRPLLLYIHGFNSSPLSTKAQVLGQYIKNQNIPCEYIVPQLPEWPGESARMLYEMASVALEEKPVYIIGSSLGGYFGTWLMERLLEEESHFPVKLVLINPAVRPYELFEEYLGPQKYYYSDDEYELTTEHIEQLRHLEVAKLHHPDNILLLAQTGDETLDYRLAVERYSDCPQRIDERGSHAYEDFAESIPMIFSFFSPMLAPTAA